MANRREEDYKDFAAAMQHAEAALVGHIFWQPDRSLRIFERIGNPDVFSGWLNKQIYKAYLHITKSGDAINSASIMKFFEETQDKAPSGILNYLIKASDIAEADIFTESAIDQYVDTVLEGFYMGKFREYSGKARNMNDIQRIAKEVLDWSVNEVASQRTPATVMDQVITRQELIYDGSVKAGYSWGIDGLDSLLHIRPGHFYTIGGLKKSGKTLFMLSALKHNLTEDEPAPSLMFSLEMSDEELYSRLLSNESGVNSRLIHTKYLPRDKFDEIKSAADVMKDIPLTVDDQANMSIVDVIVRTRGWKFKNNIPDGTGIVAVDFMQLMNMGTNKNETTAESLKKCAYELAKMAKELKLAVVALAQLSNAAEGHVPHIRFLEGSGGIAQASEGILLLDLAKRRDPGHESGNGYEDIDIHVTQRSGVSEVKVQCQADLRTGSFFEKMPEGF